MTYLVFNEEHICTHSEHSNERYGSWSTDYSFTPPTEAWIQESGSYGSFPYVGPTPKEGDVLYVSYVIVSSGDSFGHSDGGHYEIFAVSNDAERASRNVAAVKKITDTGKFSYETDGNQALLELDDGSTTKLYTGSWTGYFESINEIETVEVLVMGDANDR